MSRCFPLPPRGYEAKLRSEHKDLLKKEKQKAKKHKKERTDGEERERKEKKRDHRKDKHKKKHKREKHKERTKKKERDKETRQILEQGTHKNDDLDNRRPKQIIHNEAVKDSKHKDELASHVTGQGHANNTGSSTGKLFHRRVESFGVVGSKEKERTSVGKVNEKSGQIGQHNHGSEKGKHKTRVLNSTSVQVGSAEKHYTSIHGSNGVGLQHESSRGVLATTADTQQKRRFTPSSNDAQRTEQVDQHSDGSSHSAYGKGDSMSIKPMTENKNGSANNFHSRIDKQLVRGKNGAVEGSAKIKEEKTNRQEGVKDGDRGHVVNHRAVKDRDIDHTIKKRKAKDENEGKFRKVGHEQKHFNVSKELDGHGAGKNYIHEMDSAHLNGNTFTSDDVKKRKDLNANSSLHEHSMRMTKLPRTSPAKHRVNGETLKHSLGTGPCSSKLPVGTNLCEADMLQDNKDRYNNGITGAHYLEEHKSSVSSSSYDSNEVSLTPPHPDTKYLSQVNSIPAVADWSEYIDQDWLFSGDRVHQKSTVLGAAESPQVWAEAQPIDSPDVVVMPYVVPL